MQNRRPPTTRPSGKRTPYSKKPNSRQARPGRFSNRDDRGNVLTRDDVNQFGTRGDGRAQKRNTRGRPQREGNNYPPARPGKLQHNLDARGKGKRPATQENKVKITSDLQVTDGRHRGKLLLNSTSPNCKPTPRRIREMMFKILARRVRAGRFLDLCSGNGVVGIEAISRGAMISTFVDRSPKMCKFVSKNLEICSIRTGHGEVIESEALPFLKRMFKRRRFWDVVYFDPPYHSNYDEALGYFRRGTAIKPEGMLIIQHHAEMFFPEKIGVLKRWRVVTQGDSALTFYERR